MKPYMRPIYAGAHACGTAVTVLLQPGDNWMLHVAAEQSDAGRHRRRGCTADYTDGFFGDLLATSFGARRGRAGDRRAASRDVKDLTGMQFSGLEPRDQLEGHREGDAPARSTIPVVCAGMSVNPGDVVLGRRRRRRGRARRDRRRRWPMPPRAREANEGEKRAQAGLGCARPRHGTRCAGRSSLPASSTSTERCQPFATPTRIGLVGYGRSGRILRGGSAPARPSRQHL
jgi:4-hydroxy-4-methyl-2-oxoglutarate aldolase